jgi:RHS repeat-associated protein
LAFPGFALGTMVVPSPDGGEAYVFDHRGRHVKTLDGLTGALRWEFDYDSSRRLAAVRDGDGNSLQIQRAADGRPQALIAPGGHRTTLTLDGAGRVDGVTNPAAETTSIGYDGGGLLTTFTRPGGRTSRYVYDGVGRLVRAENAVGAVQQLTRTETRSATTVEVTSGEGRVTKYTTEALANGDRRRTVERPSGATTRLTVTPEGTRVRVAPDGTTTTQIPGPDPRWGMRAPIPLDEVTRTPAGKTMHIAVTRETDPPQPENPFAIDSMSTRITRVDGAGGDDEETEISYDAVERTIETTSAEDRHSLATLDSKGRVIRVEPDTAFDSTLVPITITYDARGRVQSTSQGSQSWTFAYDAANHLQSRTDAGGATVGYSYDLAGRLTQERYPGGHTYTYTYRAGDGRLESVTMPEGQVHQFEADAENRLTAYRPPLAPAAYRRAYDRDSALELFTFPSGATRDPVFDAGGREESTEYGPERDAFAYPVAQERASSMTRTPNAGSAQRLDRTYDGLLPTGFTSAGPASGAYTFDFGTKFRLAKATLTTGADAAHETEFAYDLDGLPTTYGPFTLTRGASGGAVSALSDGTLTATFAYDGLGRLASRELGVGGTTKYKAELTRDNRGRITNRAETVDGDTGTLDYSYDDNGELTQVNDGAAVVEAYGYDRNGNRTTPAATYDAGDRLVQRGGTSYTFNADGFLAARGADTFTYSPSGALLSATVGATTVTYAYDAIGRRTARTQDATEQYLYGDPTNPFKVTASRTAAGELTTYYYDQADALFALERVGTRYYVGSDQVGTPKVVFEADGTIVKRLEYDSYGDLISDSDPAFELPIGFAGGLTDPVTGLVRFGVRDYDPEAGRFTARDPIFFEGSPFNLYAYAGSNPTGVRDPTGLECFSFGGYSGIGGGIQYCRKDGKQSICGEVGVGAGGGVEYDPFGGVAEDGATLVGEVTGKWGPASGTLGFETDLDCFNTKGSAKVGLAPLGISAGVDTDGQFSSSFGPSDDGEQTPDGKWGAKTEGKVAVKACGQF